MGSQGMQQPQMNGQGMQQPQMGSQGMQQPQMGSQSVHMGNKNGDQQFQVSPAANPNDGVVFTEAMKAEFKEKLSDCEARIKNYVRPSTCCHYPVMTIENTSAMVCLNECNNTVDKYDCEASCMFRELKLIDDNLAMVPESWKEFFLRGLDRDKVPRGKWPEVVNASVHNCITLIVNDCQMYDYRTKPKLYYNVAVRCILRENFVACVDLKKTEECAKIKNFLNDPISCYISLDRYMSLNTMWDYKET